MTVCVECGEPVATTVERRDVGGVQTADSIRLARCKHCGRVCDKYEEYDVLLIELDAMLLRRPALRHLLCNVSVVEDADSKVFTGERITAVLSVVFWIIGLRPTLVSWNTAFVAAILLVICIAPFLVLGLVCKMGTQQLQRVALVALNVVFPFCCFCLVWGPQPYFILHGFSLLLYMSILFNAFMVLGRNKHSGKQDKHDSNTAKNS